MDTIRVNALEAGSAGNEVSIEITDAQGEGEDIAEQFNMTIRGKGGVTEQFDNLTMRRGRGRYAETVLNDVATGSKLIRIVDAGAGGTLAERRPNTGTYNLAGGAEATTAITPAEYQWRRRRPHRHRRPRGDRRDHHGLRARPDVRLPAAA